MHGFDADLKSIFESREYLAQREAEPARFWLPVILAYTGARRDEIADLALSDIGEEDGIHYFDLKPDAARGRRLKNKASKRRVPIHSHLIRLGFLKYIDVRRSKGQKLVFGEGHGDPVSKWFARLLKKLKIEGKTLHGLRSTVNTKLHEGGCDPETRRALLGHSGVDVNETVYLRLPLKTLGVNLEKLRYKS
jgi:integrase